MIMRIGLVIYGSLDTVTGGYIYDKKLVQFLYDNHCEVKIFSQYNGSFIKVVQNNFSKKSLDDIIDFSPDILLQDKMNYASLFFLNKKIKKYASFPIISIVHAMNSFKNIFLAKIEKNYLNAVDGFIFNSFSTKTRVENKIGVATSHTVAYPGKNNYQFDITEKDIFEKANVSPIKIIFVANLLFNKGLHVLLKALSQIDCRRWELSVVGNVECDKYYFQQILKMIKYLKLIKNVNILGPLHGEFLKTMMQNQHIFVVPSYDESFGLVYAEAMGAGLPIIASGSGGAIEIVEQDVNGFLVTPGQVDEVRDLLLKLIENKALLIQMSLASLSRYQRLATWEDSMKNVFAFLVKMHKLYSS